MSVVARHAMLPIHGAAVFTNGAQLRVLSLITVIQSAFGNHATYQYAELYRVQTLGWDMEMRSRFSSFSGIFRVPGALLTASLIRLGNVRGGVGRCLG